MNEEKIFIETEISEWKDFYKINENFLRNFIFRGQSDKNWQISSSLERLVNRLHPNYIDPYLIPLQEKNMLEEFKWKAKLFKIDGISEENNIEWLSIMQHYGSATRLVDFTDSLYVSIFMSIFESSTDASIWCLNKITISHNIFEYYRRNKEEITSIETKKLYEYSLNVANQSIEKAFNNDEKNIMIVRPKEINERLYKQQGLFLMSTNIKLPFMENLKSIINNDVPINMKFKDLADLSYTAKQNTIAIIKINIPRNLHKNIIRNLKEMNINSESLFPGIEGLAKSVNYSKMNV